MRAEPQLVTLVLPQSLAEELDKAARLPIETAAVMYASVVNPETGSVRVLGRGIRWIDESYYVRRGVDHMTIASEGYVRFLGEAEKLGAIAIWVHTHPGEESWPTASKLDDEVDRQIADLFRLRSGNDYYSMLIVSPRKRHFAFTGYLHLESGAPVPFGRTWIVGDRFASIRAFDAALVSVDAAFDRNVRAFGGGIQETLSDLCVGIVGCGGTGSAVAEQLVRLGVRSFMLCDPDQLSESNVTRVYGSSPADIGKDKVEVLARNLARIAPTTETRMQRAMITSERTARELCGCDVVFGCTDDNAGRLVLSRLATYFLTPVIDCGVLLSSDGNDQLLGIDGRVTTLVPGQACLVCRGRIDTKRAAAELMTPGERRMRPMPAIYKLAMPDPIDEPDEEPDSRLGGVRSLADSESIEKLIRPFHNDLSTLAEVTGINRTSLVYRTHQLMCKLVPPNEWSEEAERRYRRTSDIAGLRLGFTRPRAWVARRAVAHLFAELVDVGRLKPAIATQLTFLIRFHDPYLYTAQESVRPEWIKQATALQNTYSVRDDWLASVDEALQLLGTETNDGRVIIAEETTLRRFVSDDPVEIRRSYLCAADGDIDSCCYAECSQWTVADYAKPSYLQDSERIIVKNRGTRFENPGRFWIALNPFLARHLGWKLAGDRGFAWEDDGGRTMVESLWWVDGPQEVSGHPVGADEVGEGWCVVASSEAVAVILGAVPNARFHQFVRREKSGGDKPESISQCERQSTIRS